MLANNRAFENYKESNLQALGGIRLLCYESGKDFTEVWFHKEAWYVMISSSVLLGK